MYIDESGDFKDGEGLPTGRNSIVGGWIADNDLDHDELRQRLTAWYHQVENGLTKPEYHATHWRKQDQGRKLLKQICELAEEQKPYRILLVENRSKSTEETADGTYLDILVELIVDALFDILEKRRNKDAFPLQVYVAERKGVPDWEI